MRVAVRPIDVFPYHPELLRLVSLPAVFSVDEDSICSDSKSALALSATSLALRVPFLLLDRWYKPNPRQPPPPQKKKKKQAVSEAQADTAFANTHI